MNRHSALRIALLALLLSKTAHAQQHTVFLVRHAEKSSTPASDPTLSEAGMARAERLAARLSNAHPVAIFTSQYQRTQLTAGPLASAEGLTLTIIPVEKANASSYPQYLLQRICALPENTNIVIIGHSDTIPELAAAWTGRPVAAIRDDEYDRILMVQLNHCQASGLLDLRY